MQFNSHILFHTKRLRAQRSEEGQAFRWGRAGRWGRSVKVEDLKVLTKQKKEKEMKKKKKKCCRM